MASRDILFLIVKHPIGPLLIFQDTMKNDAQLLAMFYHVCIVDFNILQNNKHCSCFQMHNWESFTCGVGTAIRHIYVVLLYM